MTALNDVLKAEEEAKQIVETAKTAATTAVQEAKDNQKDKLEKEEKRLAEATKTALANEETKVSELADSINDEVDAKVKIIEQHFGEKKESLKTAIMERFK